MAIMFKKTAVILFLLSQVITVSGSCKKNTPFKTIKRSPKTRVEDPNFPKTITMTLRKSKSGSSPLGSSPLSVSELTLSDIKPSLNDTIVETENQQKVNDFNLVVKEKLDSNEFTLFNFKEVPTKPVPVIERLIEAILSGDLIYVRSLISKEVDLNSLEKGQRTPFMLAIQTENFEMANAFLSTGRVDPNILGTDGSDVLTLAAKHLGLNFIQNIISGPIKLTSYTVFNIISDLKQKKSPIFNSIIAALTRSRDRYVLSAIIVMTKDAVIANDIEFVRFAQRIGIPLNICYRGVYFIHFAAIRGYTDLIKLLVECGTPIDILTETTNISPLQSAYSHKRSDAAVELIKMGAIHGLVECVFNAILDNNIPIIQAFISTYPNLSNIFNFENGLNPITLAISADKPEILQLFLQSETINTMINDALGNNIYNMDINENSSEELKEIINRERSDAAEFLTM